MKMHSILAVLLLTTQFAFATSFYIRPFPEFTRSTANIIHGKLSGIHVENGVTSDGGKTIYTYAKLDIKEILKGNISGTEIIVRKLGGSKDGVTLEIPSAVEFSENEDGVFFLSAEKEDHSYEVAGMELGKFALEEKDGEQILKGGLFSYSKPPTDADHQHDVNIANLAENHKAWSLTQLKELVRSQGTSPAPAVTSEVPKTSVISTSSNDLKNAVAIPSDNQTAQEAVTSPEKEKSPLYFNATVWYSLATIILTLGVVFYLRRK